MRLQRFGYIGGLTIMLLLVPTAMISNALFHPRPSKGFYVRYPKHQISYAQNEPPPVVYLDQHRRLFLNSRLLSREQLQTELRAMLVRRPDHIAYLYADRDLTWQDAVETMELIQQASDAEVVISSLPAEAH